ncbi:hypothetical protein ACLQ2N_34900 [Streptomyces sp. DT224]|uniref:hypothetical protein n=1 Tax=Streptomyces sp. DT224 TaxID=3393426 RepID=UPI003CFAFD88
MNAYAHAQLQSFADSNNLLPELLRARGAKPSDRGACFHNSVRPDPATGETAQRRYADELSDMAVAYLLTPDRRGPARGCAPGPPLGRTAGHSRRRQ